MRKIKRIAQSCSQGFGEGGYGIKPRYEVHIHCVPELTGAKNRLTPCSKQILKGFEVQVKKIQAVAGFQDYSFNKFSRAVRMRSGLTSKFVASSKVEMPVNTRAVLQP